jgi:tetratricopeptide (TPR) repeat protein
MRSFSIIFLLIIIITSLTSCRPKPEKSKKYLDKGIEYYYQSKFKEALNYFKKAVKEDNNNYEAWYWLGNYYANSGKYTKAIDMYTKAVKVNPNYADAFANRGFAKEKLKNKEGACADWRKAKQLGKPNLDSHLKWCY